MAVKFTRIFLSKYLKNIRKFGLLECKYTIWQPWLVDGLKLAGSRSRETEKKLFVGGGTRPEEGHQEVHPRRQSQRPHPGHGRLVQPGRRGRGVDGERRAGRRRAAFERGVELARRAESGSSRDCIDVERAVFRQRSLVARLPEGVASGRFSILESVDCPRQPDAARRRRPCTGPKLF
jgi:hypothetical protein